MSDVEPLVLMKKIREMDEQHDWTHKRTDEQLLNNCKEIISESKKLKEDCQKYGFYYFDTFENRQFVLEKITKIIKTQNIV